MRGLPELLATTPGRAMLETRGVLSSEGAFVERLRLPASGDLVEFLGIDASRFPVYAAHQIKADYPSSVIAKLRAVRDLERRHQEVTAVLVWLDLDRAGADKQSTGIHLRGRGGDLQIRLSSRRHDGKEVRFVPVERSQLEETVRKLGAWARQHGAPTERSERLAAAALGSPSATLAEVNLALTSFLVREHLTLDAPSVMVSALASRGLLTGCIDEVVDAIDDVITVFNGAIQSLIAADIDPQVQPLAPDYLPLHYSCDRDGRRCSLTRERRGADHFATTTCVCGRTYTFHLGSSTLSIADLAATGRWSPDVTLPIYLNDLASGLVAGRSSALYGLVLNEVVAKVLARTPIPMLVPPDLIATLAAASGEESLLHEYMTGS